MNAFSILTSTVESSPSLLEWCFIATLTLGLLGAGVFGIAVVARLVDPSGLRSLRHRLSGKNPPR